MYTQEVLAVVLQQLMEQTPLPVLLMRTVIQSLALYNRLIGLVMNILTRLASRQVGHGGHGGHGGTGRAASEVGGQRWDTGDMGGERMVAEEGQRRREKRRRKTVIGNWMGLSSGVEMEG